MKSNICHPTNSVERGRMASYGTGKTTKGKKTDLKYWDLTEILYDISLIPAIYLV